MKEYNRGMESVPKIWFDVILYPHRSLSERGFLRLMLFFLAISFSAGLVFFLLGAWPVVGFFGLDVLAVYVAFRLNYRAAKLCERIFLTDDALTVSRTGIEVKDEQWQFQPYWVRVLAEQVDEYEGHITLTSHGRRLNVGEFLSWDEKAELAAALRQALSRQRRDMTYNNGLPV